MHVGGNVIKTTRTLIWFYIHIPFVSNWEERKEKNKRLILTQAASTVTSNSKKNALFVIKILIVKIIMKS